MNLPITTDVIIITKTIYWNYLIPSIKLLNIRIVFLATLLCISLSSKAQTLKERRVYYLDCSFSMVTKKLWQPVRDNLMKAIDNVNDETTELIVIPFAFDNAHHNSLHAFSAKANHAGKQALKKSIASLKPKKSTMTYHSDPLKDFYASRVNPNRVTYLFFMTDGQNEEKPNQFLPLLKEWNERYGKRNVYGFYVMLNNDAKNSNVEKTINDQDHLWLVETANININLVRLQPNAIFNARNDSYFQIPIYGKYKGKGFDASFDSNSRYHVRKCSVENGKLRVYVDFDGDVHNLPKSLNQKLTIKMTGGDEYDFLVTETINVKCESKPERSLKISVK